MTRGAAAHRTASTGRFIVIVGPDGTGKSGLADALVALVSRHAPVRRFHHRLRVLPASADSRRLTTTPHARAPYPRWLSNVKLLYLFADALLGWLVKVRPFVRRGGWVIVERGWWDLVVDPARYRVQPGGRWAARLGRLLPEADRTLVLDAPAEVIWSRKQELPIEELQRQLQTWHALVPRIRGAVAIDASQTQGAVARAAADAAGISDVGAVGAVGAARLTGLPPGGRPRWLIPSAPTSLTRAGLAVHQPMTTKGRVGWEAARALAATGLFRLLPEADGSTVTSAVRPFVPSGGSVAIAFTRDARAVVLILDDEGRATGVAKVARDAAGRAKLAQEADRLRRFAPLLEPPVSAPRLLAAEDGLLMLEPIAWRPRRRPWLLPMDVAMGMGRFHALTVSRDGEAGHPGHGDLAPWNVMRSSDGWVVLDWEEAMPAAPPYEDPFHYLVQAHALLGRPRRGELLAGISGEGWVGRALHAYAQAAHVESTDRPTAFADYLRRSAALLDTSRADGARGVEARRRLLLELGASA